MEERILEELIMLEEETGPQVSIIYETRVFCFNSSLLFNAFGCKQR